MQLTKGAIGNLINRYKAVLKKCHLMNTFGSLAVAGMLVMGGAGMAVAADAQDVALKGENSYDSKTQSPVNHLMGGWLVNDAATAGDAKGDITLTVNGGTISEIIGGSYAKGLTAAENNKLLTVTHGDITTTISDDTTSAEFVVGGSKVAGGDGANLETGKTSLTINDGTFGTEDKANYELVMGGNYAKTAGNSELNAATEGSSVTVNGGTFHASVVGGSVAHNYSGNGSITVTDNGNTSVTITGGTFNPSQSRLTDEQGGINLSAAVIGGGLAYGANTSTVLGSKEAPANSSVSISGDKTAINGKVVAGSVVANNGGTAIVHGNTTLAMAGGTAHDDLIGGGMVENATKLPEDSISKYNLNITGDSFVTVTGGNALGEVIGGNYVKTSTAGLENSAKVANSSVTIKGGTFAKDTDSSNKAQYIIGGSKTNASGGGNATTLVEGNSSVLIDGDVTIKDGALIGGSQAKAGNGEDPKATAIVKGNSSVTVNEGTLAGVVGGGIAETYYSATATAESTVDGTSFVAINGGKVTGNSIETGAVASNTRKLSAAVVGGGLANDKGSTATVGSTSVTIADGTINGKVVAGGAAVNGGSSTVKGDTSLTMTGGEVDGDLIGGGFVDMNNATDNVANVGGSTHITVSGGSLVDAEIIGGGSMRNANGTANVKDTYVTVTKYDNSQDKQNWVQYVLGGGKAMTNGTHAMANVTGSTNVIIGEQGAIGEALDIKFGTVAGGGLARAQKAGDMATANVDNNANVTVHSGILSGVAGGGIAESYNTGTATATVTGAANLTINGGTINGVKYKGVDTNKVKVAVLGGGIAKGTGATANATTTNTVINDGTITGHVVAGGLADGGTANVTNANLTINGGEINGSVYAGGAALNSGTATVENFDVRITGGNITEDVVAGNYTGETPETKAVVLKASPSKDTASKGTITIGGDATIGGKVDASAEGVATNVIIDGADAEVTGGYEGNKDSTLTFNNYNTTFGNTATGFGTLSVAEGSNVEMDNLSTGKKDGNVTGFFGSENGNDITVTGEGTVTAAHVNVDESKALTVADGGTLVAESLTTAASSTAKTDGLGSTLIIRNDTLKDIANGSLSSTAGSEIQFTGLADGTALNDITVKLATTSNTGIVNVGDTKVTELNGLVKADGTVAYSDWAAADAAGITNNELKHATMTGVQGTNAAHEAPDELNGVAVSGIKLNSGNAYIGIHKSSNVTLTGLGGGENFVSRKDGSTGGILLWNGDNTITLGDNAYTGSKKITYIGFGGGKHTVNALGQDRNASRIIVTMGINGNHTNANVVNASHVTLQVEKTIGDFNNPSADHHLSVNADAANVLAGDHILVGSLSLKNGSLVQAGKDIVISGAADSNLSGQGMVDAGQTLTLQEAYIGKEGDDLTLQADTLKTDAIDSITGDLAIAATNLVTSGETKLVDDTLVAEKVALGDKLDASGKSIVEVGGFYTNDSFATEGLGQGVSVKGESLMAYGASAEQAQQAVAETGHTGAAYYAGKELKLVDDGGLTVGDTAGGAGAVAFGSDSLLVVDGTAMNGKTVFTGTVPGGPDAAPDLTASVDAGSKLHVDNAVAGNFTVFGDGFTSHDTGWADENVTTDSAMLDASYDATNKDVIVKTNNAHTVFPNLSDGMADAVNDLYNGKLNNVDSTDMGVRFLSRATNDHFLGADKDAAAATIESAARIAFAGAVPQMTKMASDAGTNAVVNRLGFANPADGAQAMNAEGKIVDRNTTGFALWIAPLWQSQHGWGMEADNLDYGFNGNLGGVSLGADYTFENAIRAGITFNIGGGYAESSGGDLNSTENRMSFWGLGAYAGWNYENFGLMADVSYTSTWNDLKQDMDSRMGMGDLEADVQASAISAGLRAEYKLETSVLDVIPHIGVRYMSLNTWGFDAESNGGTVLEGDGFHQDIWTFPVGVTFTKDFTLDSGWSFKPSVDFSVIPAAGDIKAKQDVAFTGLPGSYEVETQMMDYLTWQGGVGLEMGNDTMSFGVNYTLQAGQHTTGHGVFGSFRYEF